MADNYEGDIVYTHCPVTPGDFSQTYVWAVTGVAINPCGHSLLNVGGIDGWYFHATDRKGPPRAMGRRGFERYMRATRRSQLWRSRVFIPKPYAAWIALRAMLMVPYRWMVLPHNCVHFVEIVIQAGGVTKESYSNCPALGSWLGEAR